MKSSDELWSLHSFFSFFVLLVCPEKQCYMDFASCSDTDTFFWLVLFRLLFPRTGSPWLWSLSCTVLLFQTWNLERPLQMSFLAIWEPEMLLIFGGSIQHCCKFWSTCLVTFHLPTPTPLPSCYCKPISLHTVWYLSFSRRDCYLQPPQATVVTLHKFIHTLQFQSNHARSTWVT